MGGCRVQGLQSKLYKYGIYKLQLKWGCGLGIKAKKIPQRESFRYLNSIISKDEDVKHRITTGWFKCRLAFEVLLAYAK